MNMAINLYKLAIYLLYSAYALVLFMLFVPFLAHAASYTYSCTSDFDVYGGVSCSGANFQFENAAGAQGAYTPANNDPDWNWTNSTTYYFVVTSTGSVGQLYIDIDDDQGGSGPDVSAALDVGTTEQFTMTLAFLVGANDHIAIKSYADGASDALVTKLCVSDTSYADCGGGSPPPDVPDPLFLDDPSWSGLPIYATTTLPSTDTVYVGAHYGIDSGCVRVADILTCSDSLAYETPGGFQYIDLGDYVASYPDGTYLFWSQGDPHHTYLFFEIVDGVVSFEVEDFTDTTRIVSTDPINGETVATSSSIVINYYVTSADLSSTTELKVHVESYGCTYGTVSVYTVVENPCLDYDYSFFPDSVGDNVASTSIVYGTIGGFTITSRIVKPSVSLFGFTFFDRDLIDPYILNITVATSTVLDQLHRVALDVFNAYASSTAVISNVCNPLLSWSTFDLGICLYYLFVPTLWQAGGLQQDFMNFASIGPWGFIGTTVAIIKGDYFDPNDSTELPALEIDLKDSGLSNVVGINEISIDPWDEMIAEGSILGDAESPKDGKTIREIVEPGWVGFVMLVFGVMVMSELLGLGGKFVNSSMDVQEAQDRDNRRRRR